jgi:hypothetical protein
MYLPAEETDLVLSAEIRANLPNYIFSPVEGWPDLKPDVRTTGIQRIDRGWLQPIRTHRYPDRALEGEQGLAEAIVREERVTSEAIADGLYRAFAFCGLVVVRSLIGAPSQLAGWLQHGLIGEEPPDNVLELRDVIQRARPAEPYLNEASVSWLQASRLRFEALFERLREELVASCSLGEIYCRTFYGTYLSEMEKRKLPGQFGIGHVTPKLRKICRELRVTPPDDVAAEIERLQREGGGTVGNDASVMKLLEALVQSQIAANNRAVAASPVEVAAALESVRVETPGIETPSAAEKGCSPQNAEIGAEPKGTIDEKAKTEAPFAEEKGPVRGAGGRFVPRS